MVIEITEIEPQYAMQSELPDGKDILFFSGYAIARIGWTNHVDSSWWDPRVEFSVGPIWASVSQSIASVSLGAIDNLRTDDSPRVGWAINSHYSFFKDNRVRLNCKMGLMGPYDDYGDVFISQDQAHIIRLVYSVTATGELHPRAGPLIPKLPCVTNISIVGATANAEELQNPASHAVDGDLTTRWNTPTLGAFITTDLGSVKKICRIEIKWYRGNERKYHFNINTSTDNADFTEVYSGDSSGTTLNHEKYKINKTDARYVRITVNGNTQNSYASIYDIDVFGP